MGGEADIRPMIDDAAVGRSEVGVLEDGGHVPGLLRLADDLVAGGHIAGKRQGRDQDRGRRERGPRARVPALGAQPEMNSDRGVHPYGQQRGALDEHVFRRDHPLQHQDLDVIAVHVQQFAGNAGCQDVDHQQRRDAQPEAELPPLPCREPQIAPLVDRPQRVGVVREPRREQDRGADAGAPRRHQHREHAVGDREGNEQGDVADEVADHEGEHDERADEPQPRPHRPHVPVHGARRRCFATRRGGGGFGDRGHNVVENPISAERLP